MYSNSVIIVLRFFVDFDVTGAYLYPFMYIRYFRAKTCYRKAKILL